MLLKIARCNNKSSSTKDIFLYVIKFLDEDILSYLKESEEAVNSYYTVEIKEQDQNFIALIYIIIVTLLLFLSITITRFSSRFFISINNLISASSIGKGNLDTKVPA